MNDTTASVDDATSPTAAGLFFEISPHEKYPHAIQAGELCPACRQTKLDYDGCLNLVCPTCGYYASGGCYT